MVHTAIVITVGARNPRLDLLRTTLKVRVTVVNTSVKAVNADTASSRVIIGVAVAACSSVRDASQAIHGVRLAHKGRSRRDAGLVNVFDLLNIVRRRERLCWILERHLHQGGV